MKNRNRKSLAFAFTAVAAGMLSEVSAEARSGGVAYSGNDVVYKGRDDNLEREHYSPVLPRAANREGSSHLRRI